MSRPQKCRFIKELPDEVKFQPIAESFHAVEEVIIGFDELEALRLADFQGLSHQESADVMGVSRATFGRILEKARKHSADALINRKRIYIRGGKYCDKTEMKENCSRRRNCPKCFKNSNNISGDENV